MSVSDAKRKDEECIGRARRRLLRAHRRLGSWRAVGAELGVNHGNASGLVKDGTVPVSKELRAKLGLPKVLPSERKPRVRRVMPLLGSPCWMCMAFKKVKAPRAQRRQR